MKNFNKIVNKMWKKCWNIVFKKDIFELVDPELKSEYSSFVDKCIYKLRAEWYIISLKSGVYIVPERGDSNLNTVDLMEKYYLKLLKKYIREQVGSHYYISGKKSLEFHLKDYSIPEKIYVVNRSLDKKIIIGKHEIVFKTLSWKSEGKKINLYNKFSEYKKEIEVEGISLKISGIELALLEASLVTDIYDGLDTHILSKALKKYGDILSEDIFREIGKYKYNMSLNRLKELSKTLNRDLYLLFLDIIKKNWACFVGEGLRGI